MILDGRHSYIDDGVTEGEPTCTVHIIIIIIIITGHGIHWEYTSLSSYSQHVITEYSNK